MMVDTACETTEGTTMAHTSRRDLADRPRLMGLERVRRELGDIGKTRLYDIVREHGLRLLKFGGRTLIPTEDIDRVIDTLLASAKVPTTDRVKAMALKSVEARRQMPPRKRRRRGSSDPA